VKPVWIKYWGLIPMTRRGYLIALAVTAAVAVLTFLVLGFMGLLPPLRTLWQEVPVRTRTFWQYWFYNNLYRIVALGLLGEAVDTFVVLRRFAKKQAEQRACESPAAMPEKTDGPAAGPG